MKTVWFSGYKKFLLVLMGLVLLGACGSDTNEDLTPPTLTMDPLDPSTFTRERTLSGQVETGAELQVFVNTGANVGNISIDGGVWSFTITDLAVGNNLVTISADDSQGNTRSLQFFLIYEILKIDQADTVTSQTSSTVHGRLAPDASITSVTLNGAALDPLLVTTVTGDDFSLDLESLAAGSNTVAITAQDAAANLQTISRTIVNDGTAVSLTINKPPVPVDVLELSGTVDAGATVTVLKGLTSVGEVSYDGTGTVWSVPIGDLEEGDSILDVTAEQEGKTTASTSTRVVVVAP